MPVQRVVVISHVYLDAARRGKLRALAARDLDVTVGVPQRWTDPALGRPLEARWERQGGVETFPIPGQARVAGALRFGRRELRSLLRDKRPDVVQIEEEPETSAAAQVTRGADHAGIPAVLFLQDPVRGSLSWAGRWRRRRTLERVQGVIAGSEAAAELVREEQARLPVVVIPQLGVGVATAPEHAFHEGLAIGYVGRLVPEKGVDTLLEALALNRAQPWHLILVGEGPERERLERLAAELRLAPRIRWAGALPPDQIALLWPELDVLVLPSRATARWREPVAHALVEAMAHEVAVVGSDSGVIPEVIGDAGLVVPAGDAAALAQALGRVAQEGERAPLVRSARARAMQRFSDDAIAERTIEFWREIVK